MRGLMCAWTLACALAGCLLAGCHTHNPPSTPEVPASNQTIEAPADETPETTAPKPTGLLADPEDIDLTMADEYGERYTFWYDGEVFSVYYEPGCWKVYDSYRITNPDDITIICQALLDEHEVLRVDGESPRTAEDMAYEWQQHNLAYHYAPADSSLRERAASVDLDSGGADKDWSELFGEE